MAVSYIGATNTNPSSTANTDITLPVGSAAGDIAVLFLSWAGNVDETFTTSNFTEIIARTAPFSRPGAEYQYVQSGYRTITAGDITNGFITITSSGDFSSSFTYACMAVFRGGVPSPTFASASSSGTNPSYANTITPSANSIIFLWEFAAGFSNNTQSASAQAVTTDNPSWTEIQDSTTTNGDDGHQSVAYAIRSAATATGNSTLTLAFTASSWAMLVSFAPTIDVTVSPAVIGVVASVQAPSVTGGATVTVGSAIGITASVQAPTVSMPADTWSNQDKSSSSWTNTDKS